MCPWSIKVVLKTKHPPPRGKKRNTKTVPFLLGSRGFPVLGVSRGLTHGEVDDKYKCTTLNTAWAEATCLQMMGGSRLILQLSLFRRSWVRFPPYSEIFLSPWLLHKEVPNAVDQQRLFIHLMHIVELATLELSSYTNTPCFDNTLFILNKVYYCKTKEGKRIQ